jgi:hypothetical protein
MEHLMRDIADSDLSARARATLELDALLHPSRKFARPMDVVHDSSLSLNEKRAVLASWASDACALEAAPELRCVDSGSVVRWDDVMDALRLLDKQSAAERQAASKKPQRAPRVRSEEERLVWC